MKVVKLFLPGHYEDAYIYMGHLVALTQNRTLELFNLDHLVDSLDILYPELQPVMRLMFSRNDWLSTAQFKTMTANRGIIQSILSSFDLFPSPHIEIDKRTIESNECDLRIQAQCVFDILPYNTRVYLCTDSGLHHLDVDWNTDESFILHRHKRHDARCLNATARYGAVSFACGKDGSYTFLDEFNSSYFSDSMDAEKITDSSIRIDWFNNYDLINYSSYSSPLLIRNKHDTDESSSANTRFNRGSRRIIKIGDSRIELGSILETALKKHDITTNSIQFTHNSDNSFFINTNDGRFCSLQIRYSTDNYPDDAIIKVHKNAGKRVLSARSVRTRPGSGDASLVVETYDRILLFAKNEWYSIANDEVLSARTFLGSKRYQHLVALTTERGITLAGIFDDSHWISKYNDLEWEPGIPLFETNGISEDTDLLSF